MHKLNEYANAEESNNFKFIYSYFLHKCKNIKVIWAVICKHRRMCKFEGLERRKVELARTKMICWWETARKHQHPTNTQKPNFPQVVAHTGISGYLLVHTALSLLTGAFVPRHVYTQIFDKYAIAACNTDFRQPQLESCKIYILVILIILYSRNILPQGIIVLFTQRLLT